jgi:guanyl-specific ribonuclease Sa
LLKAVVIQAAIGAAISGTIALFTGGNFWEAVGDGFAQGFMWGGIFSTITTAITAIRGIIQGLNYVDDVVNVTDDVINSTDDIINSADDVANAADDIASIPKEADDVLEYIETHNGSAPNGYKGGRTFENIPRESGAQKLPEGITYKEYDIRPYQKGVNRGTERLVIGSDGSVWFTNDHYFTFIRMK